MTTPREPVTLKAALEEADRHGGGSKRLRDLAKRFRAGGQNRRCRHARNVNRPAGASHKSITVPPRMDGLRAPVL